MHVCVLITLQEYPGRSFEINIENVERTRITRTHIETALCEFVLILILD